MSYMNPEHELMGDVRIAAQTMQKARQTLREVWDAGETMLPPLKASELTKTMTDLRVALAEMEPIVAQFADLAERRRPQI